MQQKESTTTTAQRTANYPNRQRKMHLYGHHLVTSSLRVGLRFAIADSQQESGVLAIQPQVFCYDFCYLCFFVRLIKVRVGGTQVSSNQQESLQCSYQADPLRSVLFPVVKRTRRKAETSLRRSDLAVGL